MKLWIARDKDGDLFVYENKPLRNEREGTFEIAGGECDWIDIDTFPFSKILRSLSLTWENSPQEVELKLIRK